MMKMMRISLFFLALGAAFGADPLKPVTETHTYDLAADGTIQMQNAAGDVSIEAWDQPRVEVTTVKTAEEKRVLDQVKVTAETSGNTLNIVSTYKKYPHMERPLRWTLNFDLEYRIKAPRNAKLVIEEYAGEVNITGMAGDIQATDRNGDISLLLPEAKYSIDAKSRIGAVISDFAGKETRNRLLFGHRFEGTDSGRKLYLRVGYGDVMILKMWKPTASD
jgi:hypothetical protein